MPSRATKSQAFYRSPRFPREAIPDDVGAALAHARAERGWTQTRLASEAGLDRASIVRIEAGGRSPIADTVFRLEHALDLIPGTLVPDWSEWAPINARAHGGRIRERRRELGLSLVEVAQASGVSAATLSRLERGTGPTPKLLEHEDASDGEGRVRCISTRLAAALGFGSTDELDDYCEAYRSRV